MMNSTNVRRQKRLARLDQATQVTAKSGLRINIMDDQWTIVPNPTKGHTISVAWLHSSLMSDEDWQLCIDVFISYVRTKSASTAYGVVGNTKDHLVHGIPNLTLLTGKWSGIPTHQKKSLNQFFGTLCSLGHKRFNDYHAFTRTHLNKEKRGNLDPETGSMTDFEFDSLAKLINTSLGAVDWSLQRNLAFYRSTTFSHVRTAVANKLMLAIVRRPIQLALLKWCDLIPAGASFKDKNIRSLNEMGTLGSRTLQLRVFHAKEKGTSHHRSHPERYPIPLSEELSESLLQYKRFCLEGLKLLLEESGLAIDEHDLISIVPNVPIFPHLDMFKCEANSLDFFRDAFTEASSLFHAGDQALTMDLRRIPSDRAPSCKASNNRIRHTVLTRGAQGGLPAVQLARITGVTVPAARHYVDMDYDSRRLIDANYVGNEFLRRAFSNSVSPALEGEEEILGHDFNEIGGARVAQTCRSCKTELGKPIGCYGCPNFRPILEANHRAELQIADDKLSANRAFLFNPLEINSIRKIEIQIKWINLTIEVCDEILARRRGIDAQQIS